MKKENQFEYSTNAALTKMEFNHLIARYKRAVYTKWVHEQLVRDQQKIDVSYMEVIANRSAIK